MDRYDLYELCVTDAPRLVRFIRAVHGDPRTFREDFCGSGALARAWPRLVPGGSAVAVDLDREALERAKAPGVRTVRSDVQDCNRKADVIGATNFPLGYFHERDTLVSYLRHARRCLNRRGVFFADMYGGTDAFRVMSIRRNLRGPKGERVGYRWEQREADAATGLVTDVLSFTLTPPPPSKKATGRKPGKRREFRDAFVYRWRLWSIPELRDAYLDAGFRKVELYSRLGDAIDGDGNLYVRPHDETDELDENWVIYLVGRA